MYFGSEVALRTFLDYFVQLLSEWIEKWVCAKFRGDDFLDVIDACVNQLAYTCKLYVYLTDSVDLWVQFESFLGNDFICVELVVGYVIRFSTLSLLIKTIKVIRAKILKD